MRVTKLSVLVSTFLFSACVRSDFRITVDGGTRRDVPLTDRVLSEPTPITDVATETSLLDAMEEAPSPDTGQEASTAEIATPDSGESFSLVAPPFVMIATRGRSSFVVRVVGNPPMGQLTFSVADLPLNITSPEEMAPSGSREVLLQLDGSMTSCTRMPYCTGTARVHARRGTIDVSIPINVRVGPDAGSIDREYGINGRATFRGVSRPGLDRAVFAVTARNNSTVIAGASTPSVGDNIAATLWGFDEVGRADPEFGTNGVRTFLAGAPMPPTRLLRTVRTQRDGTIFAAGTTTTAAATANRDWFAVRTNINGEPDTSFGDMNGRTIVAPSASDDEFFAVETVSTGLLLVGSNQTGTSDLERVPRAILLSNDGRTPTPALPLNLSAGSYGARITTSTKDNFGRVIFAGEYWNTTPPLVYQPFVVRTDITGIIDTSFGDRGVRIVSLPASASVAAIAYDPIDGELILAGSMNCMPSRGCPALIRLNGMTGNPGRWMVNNGPVVQGLCSSAGSLPGRFEAIALRPGGGFVAAGSCAFSGSDPLAPRNMSTIVQGFLRTGAIDTNFTSYLQDLSPSGNWDGARGITFDAQGGLVVVGDYATESGADGFVLRLWH